MRFSHLIVFVCLGFLCMGAAPKYKDRTPSAPYITGDGFRLHCKFIIEKGRHELDCSEVKEGDTIFVQTEYLWRFFQELHPRIRKRYILVTHNSDIAIPGPFVPYLLHPKIIAWFGQNVEGYCHPKLHPIPIGLENRQYSNGDPKVMDAASEKFFSVPKTVLLYNNFSLHTFPTERGKVYEIFKDKPYCVTASRKPYIEYLRDLAGSKFVLCPRGNGLDCHRVWESLYMGAIPVVKSSASDSLFDNLPVLIIDDWNQLTEEFLHQKYEEFSSKEYAFDNLTLGYWLKMIDKEKAGEISRHRT